MSNEEEKKKLIEDTKTCVSDADNIEDIDECVEKYAKNISKIYSDE